MPKVKRVREHSDGRELSYQRTGPSQEASVPSLGRRLSIVLDRGKQRVKDAVIVADGTLKIPSFACVVREAAAANRDSDGGLLTTSTCLQSHPPMHPHLPAQSAGLTLQLIED